MGRLSKWRAQVTVNHPSETVQVQLLLSPPELRSHRSVRPRTLDCQSSNMGSNPIGTAIVSVAEWLGIGLQIRIMQVRILSDTP